MISSYEFKFFKMILPNPKHLDKNQENHATGALHSRFTIHLWASQNNSTYMSSQQFI